MPKKKKARVPKGNVPVGVKFGRGNSLDAQIDYTDTTQADVDDAIDLIERCNTANPDIEDLRALRKWMERDGVRLRVEELARAVHVKSVSSYQNAFAEEAALAGVKELMLRMGYGDADPTEQLLILQTGTAWLMLQTENSNLARATTGSYSLSEAEACDKRVDRAHNRFTKATESLEKIRALRRMTEYRARPRMLVKAERAALPRHRADHDLQPVEEAEFAVVGA